MDEPQNRPASASKEQASTVPTGAPTPYPVTGGGTGGETTERTQQDGPESDTKQAAKEEGKKVAADAREQAGEVADTARQGVAEVAEEAKHQAVDLADDARRQLHDQARQQTDHLGNALQDLGGKLHALADGRTDETGQVGDYADRFADQVERIGGRVQELGFDGTLDELQRFARRRPGVFLMGAAAAGFAVSRLGRGAKDAQQQESSAGDDHGPMQAGPGDLSARPGQPPVSAPAQARTRSATSPMSPSSPTVGYGPSDVPPPPPVVPAPDPIAPRGRP